MDRDRFIAANRDLAECCVIDIGPLLRARRVAAQGVDLAAAWAQRKVQLLEESADLAREVTLAGAALGEATERFRALGDSALARLRQIELQIEDINTAIDHWRAHAPGGG